VTIRVKIYGIFLTVLREMQSFKENNNARFCLFLCLSACFFSENGDHTSI